VEAARSHRREGLDIDDEVVRAAGAVVGRRSDGRVEVLLVHRPKYDDWSFPKGKAEEGESDMDCAVREVEEETGLRVSLGPELVPTSYESKGRPKRVRYWLAEPRPGEDASARNEVDEVAWLTPDAAERRLSYNRDLDVLWSALERLDS
jgi:8-oxo-dGTP pyrophosphatase MutT (NUDIX family)